MISSFKAENILDIVMLIMDITWIEIDIGQPILIKWISTLCALGPKNIPIRKENRNPIDTTEINTMDTMDQKMEELRKTDLL